MILTQANAYMFRIVHRDNIPWILDHGLHCKNSPTRDPNYVAIGNADLISRRHNHPVPSAPGGTLSDYVPFYFTPFSPMMYNIKTGRGGIRKRENDEIVILVSSVPLLVSRGVSFLFTDRHAYLAAAQFYSTLERLDQIDWNMLQRRDFKNNPDDPSKKERYQAEALVHKHLPVESLSGFACYNDACIQTVKEALASRNQSVEVVTS